VAQFEENKMSVHSVLSLKPTPAGFSMKQTVENLVKVVQD